MVAEWGSLIKPRARLSMTILLGAWNSRARDVCPRPRCPGRGQKSTLLGPGVYICRDCDLVYVPSIDRTAKRSHISSMSAIPSVASRSEQISLSIPSRPFTFNLKIDREYSSQNRGVHSTIQPRQARKMKSKAKDFKARMPTASRKSQDMQPKEKPVPENPENADRELELKLWSILKNIKVEKSAAFPTQWNIQAPKLQFLTEDKRTIFLASGSTFGELAFAHGDKPMPAANGIFYYEVKVSFPVSLSNLQGKEVTNATQKNDCNARINVGISCDDAVSPRRWTVCLPLDDQPLTDFGHSGWYQSLLKPSYWPFDSVAIVGCGVDFKQGFCFYSWCGKFLGRCIPQELAPTLTEVCRNCVLGHPLQHCSFAGL